ncbi:FkbM family methyltransferase [Desulfobulbus alkaliphilus]|uniref:FkbM family methyltransferase n=1 Tax=Desulfobulbus alkaliphilus TaxID=869814 RepID=UPI001964DEF6|nr:FkbM family methyltransferase [Desulfobulbus alkaliphilus]MBM9538571.1 FkbM family methyltransferase [Desulfobulbus alkaliphilus]
MIEKNFLEAFVAEICSNMLNDYDDNYDFYRFNQPEPHSTIPANWKEWAKKKLSQRGYGYIPSFSATLTKAIDQIVPFYYDLQALYVQLTDETSKELLIKLMAFRCLGHRKVKLPLNTPTYWAGIQQVEQLADQQNFRLTKFYGWRLYQFNLATLNYPIRFYCTAKGSYSQFILQQYRGVSDNCVVEVEPGDYVIDAGGCWGDTALYFAHKIGVAGRVFSYEFIPSNLEILRENLSLNPALQERVQIIERAVWQDTDTALFYKDQGPASHVSFAEMPNATGKVMTLTIDDLVAQSSLPRLDFIKMDIEGAEVAALQGSINTLRHFRPKLAISVYHDVAHFFQIPNFIASLNLGYKFFLRHYTIHQEETVLFAWSDQR